MKTMRIASQIQELLAQKQRHVDALEQIDRILGNIAAMMSPNAVKAAGSTASRASEPAAPPRTGRRRRRRFEMTADEFVLGFVKQRQNPTTREVNTAWTDMGRPFKADITLSKLVRDGKLKRTPLVGERGSRYTLK